MLTVQKKICMLGQFAVGKTSLIRRFVEGRFDDRYLSTIGVKLTRKTLARPTLTLELLIWDLAGEEETTTPQAAYLRGAAGALIVCDLTRRDTLKGLEHYARIVRAGNAHAPLVFVGNKMDLTVERTITEDELAQMSANLGGSYLLASAKTGQQVEGAFTTLADQLDIEP